MQNIIALLVAGAVLAAAGTAFAGEPTGRYQGAQGTPPVGLAEIASGAEASHGGFVTSARADRIGPAGEQLGETAIALRSVGRGFAVTANIPGGVADEIQYAAAQLAPRLRLASRP